MTPFAIAGLQLYLGGHRDNFAHIRARIAYTTHLFPWVQMVVLSELATYGPSPRLAEPMPGPAERAFQELASRHHIWLIPGSLMELEGKKVFNTTPVIDPNGRVVARYRKMFPFQPYEHDVEAGTEFVVFDVPGVGRFGVSICYDMWFPETSRTLAAMGAEVILHPSMTTTLDRDAELAIARATAVQNQCYVVDINGVGEGGNGRSIFVGPEGEVLHEAGTTESVMPLELDLDRVRRSREFGLRGLGQPLKSFRDCKVDFDVYRRDSAVRAGLKRLGPLVKPGRGSRAGLGHAASVPLPPATTSDGRLHRAPSVGVPPAAVPPDRRGGIP